MADLCDVNEISWPPSKNLYPAGMLNPEQSRAARGWLNWTQAELAERANVGLSTVKDFEAGRRTPIGNNLAAIHRALEAAGIGLADPRGVTFSGDTPSDSVTPGSRG